MVFRLFAWVGKWEGSVPFSERLTPRKLVETLPSRTRRKLYVTKHGRLVHIRFPWEDETPIPARPMAEITLTEAEIFLLAKFARRNRTDEELLQAITNA